MSYTVVNLATLRNLTIVGRIDVAIAAVNLFEYLITFELERRRIWAKKHTVVTWIFVVNRYLAVIYSISMLLSLCAVTEASCRALLLIPCATFLLMGLVQAVFSSLRVRALWPHKGNLWPGIIFCLYLIPFGSDIWDYSSLKPIEPLVVYHCAPQAGSVSGRSESIVGVVVGNRLCVIIADIIVLVSTWVRTFRTRQEMVRLGQRPGIVHLMLRDGTICFLVLSSLNTTQILMAAAPPWIAFAAVNEFVHWPALYPVMISRFLLDLRQIGDIVDDDDRLSTTIAFNHMLSSNENTSFLDGIHRSMGGPLHGLFDRIVEMDSPHEEQAENALLSASHEDLERSTGIISHEVEVVSDRERSS